MTWRPPTLETPRLKVRPLSEADAEAIFDLCSNPNLTRFTLWDTHRTIDDSYQFVCHYAWSRYVEHQPEPMGIVLKTEGEPLIGTAGCFWTSVADEVMEMGYNVAESHWGHGFAVEAARGLIDHVFGDYAVHRLQLRIFEGNRSSVRVAEKLGFRLDGVLRSALLRYGRRWDVRVYSLLRTDGAV